MTEVGWRVSTSGSNSPPQQQNRVTGHQPQMAKHEQLLDEEYRTVKKGLETAKSLLDWYQSRIESLEKRKRMIGKGMVALDSAVAEQKLHFYRAQISELNRRMKSLIASSEKGFPNYENMQIRSQVLPSAPNLHASKAHTADSSATTTATNTTSSSSSPNSTPEPQHSLNAMRHQHEKLIKELEEKSKLIDQLQNERRLCAVRPFRPEDQRSNMPGQNKIALANGYQHHDGEYSCCKARPLSMYQNGDLPQHGHVAPTRRVVPVYYASSTSKIHDKMDTLL